MSVIQLLNIDLSLMQSVDYTDPKLFNGYFSWTGNEYETYPFFMGTDDSQLSSKEKATRSYTLTILDRNAPKLNFLVKSFIVGL